MAKKDLVFTASALGPAEQLELAAAVQLWKEASVKLAQASADEMAARLAIVNRWFPNFAEGTHTGSLLDDLNLKCEMRINRSVDQAQFNAAHAWSLQHSNDPDPELSAKARELHAVLVDTFVAKQELSVSVWKNMDDDMRKKLADIVTEKPGTPSIKLVPKASK